MKLLSCHIENFGHLRNYDHTFSEGLNIILHENGWGKSTLAAFLCGMLYGMPGGRARSGLHDREKYRPWQGGTYGGELIFEADGRIYVLTRTFGRRESGDTFDLRDAETNLPEFRFSANVGQELFALNRTSFLRTAMIAQQDCETRATDDILALLTDLQEQSGDMGSYEAAMKRLGDASNRLTPRRRTGSLSRRAEEILLLERETSGAKELTDRIRQCEEAQQLAREEEKALAGKLRDDKEKMDVVRRLLEDRTRFEARAAEDRERQETLRRRREEKRFRQASMEQAAAFFPGRIPDVPEVEEQLQESRRLEKLAYGMQSAMLTEAEQARLTELETCFENVPAKKNQIPHPEEDGPGPFPPEPFPPEPLPPGPDRIRGTSSTGVKNNGRTLSAGQKHLVPAAAGVVLLLLGLILLLLRRGTFCLIAGAAAALAGVLLCGAFGLQFLQAGEKARRPGGTPAHPAGGRKKDPSRTHKDITKENAKETAKEKSAADSSEDPAEEYAWLCGKEQKLEALHARWAETRRPILSFLRDLGIAPGEDLREQLEGLLMAVKEYETAQQRLQAAEQALRVLEAGEAEKEKEKEKEKERERQQERTGPFPDPVPAGALPADRKNAPARFNPDLLRTLPGRIEETQTRLLQCRAQIAETDRELEELLSEQEELETAAERLAGLRAAQETEMAAYRRINAAAAALQRAKESLTARYADPVRRSFARYWEQITASSASNVYLDANASITVEEMGRQREIDSFSAGYRDLAGVCLRIALVDAMYPGNRRERPPLIMDDPFVSLDDEKMQGALRLLHGASEKYQVLYFTCSRSRCGR